MNGLSESGQDEFLALAAEAGRLKMYVDPVRMPDGAFKLIVRRIGLHPDAPLIQRLEHYTEEMTAFVSARDSLKSGKAAK